MRARIGNSGLELDDAFLEGSGAIALDATDPSGVPTYDPNVMSDLAPAAVSPPSRAARRASSGPSELAIIERSCRLLPLDLPTNEPASGSVWSSRPTE